MRFESKFKISKIFAFHLHLLAVVWPVLGLFGNNMFGVDNDNQNRRKVFYVVLWHIRS